MPGVQKPHCEPCRSTIACCTGWSASPSARSSTVSSFGAVELAEQQNAGVDRLVAQPPALQARQDDGAGAAVAFAAALFRPLGAGLLAQPVEHRRARRETVDLDIAAAEAEAQRVTKFSRIVLQNHHRSSRPSA